MVGEEGESTQPSNSDSSLFDIQINYYFCQLQEMDFAEILDLTDKPYQASQVPLGWVHSRWEEMIGLD